MQKALEGIDEVRYQKAEAGLNFVQRHLSSPIWPRNLSTAVTRNGQRTVTDFDKAMLYFHGALWQDCRINAYGVNQLNPNLIFIDLDDVNALPSTLKNIENKIGGHPTVYNSGRGFHILQPIRCEVALESIPELKALHSEPSNKFLQFAKRYLTNGKADNANNPALKSCLLRVPGTLNSKVNNREVQVIQQWDGYRPYYRQLYDAFYAELETEFKKCESYLKRLQLFRRDPTIQNSNHKIDWIEDLIDNKPLADNRKLVVGIIISRYLINVKQLSFDETYNVSGIG